MDINRGKIYYSIAREALDGVQKHPGFNALKKIINQHKDGLVLDVGCGEGSRLDYLVRGKNGIGIDINEYAIRLAQKNFPRFEFKIVSGPTIPFKDNYFDVVYSTFVLEHTLDPETFIREMIRVLKPDGKMVIMCPNFGAPNRRSPNSIESPIKKLLRGFLKDLFGWGELHWTRVIPKKEFKNIDDDTTIEPYLLTLAKFIKTLDLKIITLSSLWPLEASTLHPRKLLFKFLGLLKIYPFSYWGPQILLVAKK